MTVMMKMLLLMVVVCRTRKYVSVNTTRPVNNASTVYHCTTIERGR